ncbi:MAG: ChbG/HpnK family deacetylase [bacterium]|nr:ChbG/HpnK family deacetylase [bacterium]
MTGDRSDKRFVVVNADDLGLHEDINRGIRKAHEEGIVTSTSLVACGQAFEDGLETLRTCSDLDPGVHLTLIEEVPLCDSGRIPSLVGENGRFWLSYRAFTKQVFRGRIRREDLYTELDAQVRRILDAGIEPSHIDSHQHVHMLSPVWSVVMELAVKYQIPYIRVPAFQDPWARLRSPLECVFRGGLNVLSRFRRGQLKRVRAADCTAGLHLSGRLIEEDLLVMADQLRTGVCEFVVHPGMTTPALAAQYASWNFDWSGELCALVSPSVQQRVKDSGAILTTYRKLDSGTRNG